MLTDGIDDLADLVVLGPRVNIAIVSRHIAERYTCEVPHAVLSITDPAWGRRGSPRTPTWWGLLWLMFDDVDPQLGYQGASIRLFDERHARTAAEFITAHVEDTELLLVHCEFGARGRRVSGPRSPAGSTGRTPSSSPASSRTCTSTS